VIVPDAGAAVALARALAPLEAAAGRRIVAATTASRAKRLLGAGSAQVVIGAPFALAPALAASVLKLDEVSTVLLAAADELDPEDPDLASLLAEVPKGANRLLTALDATPGVETIIERQMHKARRVTEDVTAAVAEGETNLRFLAVVGAPVDAVPLVLDDVDPPTTTVLTTDPAAADAARAMLLALGLSDEKLARVSDESVPPNTALVVVLGVPTGTVWAQVLAAKPAQVVAIIAPRQRAALQRLAGEQSVLPFVARSAVLKARVAEARMRAELRAVLGTGLPAREMLALEPLLGEFDGLEIAAAALSLLDLARGEKDEAVRTAEGRVRALMKEQQAAEAKEERGSDRPRSFAPRGDRPGSDRGERPPRKFPPRGGDDRGPRGPRAPRSDDFPLREPGERSRSYQPREGGDKARSYVPRASGDKPRGFASRDDKPRGFAPRGDKPRGFAPRGDKPRGPRRDDDRGPRGPRGPR